MLAEHVERCQAEDLDSAQQLLCRGTEDAWQHYVRVLAPRIQAEIERLTKLLAPCCSSGERGARRIAEAMDCIVVARSHTYQHPPQTQDTRTAQWLLALIDRALADPAWAAWPQVEPLNFASPAPEPSEAVAA